MSQYALKVEKLSKRYYLGQRETYKTLRDTLTTTFTKPWEVLKNRTPKNEIWALRDVGFEVKHGEAIGIIGRNGAGKSTLLKILSRITEPTRGQVTLNGRIGALLEVGTGFNLELTGRENIYLNGAILGMKRREISRKFDEIVDFAEIEEFIDTPVKRYSSGMYMRLAFAVAAHLETEILVIDEVLAVGDAQFQKKCLGKVGSMANEGRTVLFVSHNMGVVQRLCTSTYLLESGQIIASGETALVIETYYKSTANYRSEIIQERSSNKALLFTKWSASIDPNEQLHSLSNTLGMCHFSFGIVVNKTLQGVNFGLAVYDEDGNLVWATRNKGEASGQVNLQNGIYAISFSAPYFPVRAGKYRLLVSASNFDGLIDEWHVEPELLISPSFENGLPPRWQGFLNIKGEFNLTLMNR